MKNIIVRTFLYLSAVMLLFASCSYKKVYRIGVSQCAEGQWREKVNHEMLASQHLYEQDVKVTIASAHDDTQLQVRQIDSLVSMGIDLLVVAPNEAEPIAAAIDRARQRGIPVICFDRRVKGDHYTAFIGGSNVEAGRAIGVNVVDVAHGIAATGRKPLVLEVTALMSSSPAQERHEGFAKALEGHGELDYVCREGDWSSETTCRIVKEQIASGRLPDIVFCHNDGMATGAYKAAVETGTEGKIQIFGIDGMPGEGLDYMQLGHQLASYVYPTGGEKIVRLALDILTGKPYKRENTLKMEDLGETVGLSRVQLYRKVKAITGLSPVELLRQMRLQQGYVLLSTTNKTVQEIAHEVGFGTPGYFSKCFRQQYGKYPMELRNSTNLT